MGSQRRRRENKGHESESQWISYSDLFMNLTMVFIVLYAVAQLRVGTSVILKTTEYQQMARENEDLRQQIKVYNTLKEDYLENQAAQNDKEVYSELMQKLDLLQDQAKQEKEDLQAQALENGKKEKALNKYQALIRNIVNSNMVAQARIKRRDVKLEKNEETISEMGQDIAQKKQQIAQNEAKIESLDSNLEKRLKQLRYAYKQNKITKKNFEAQQQQLKSTHESQVAQLEDQKNNMEAEIQGLSKEVHNVKQSLTKAERLAQANEQKAQAKEQENQGLQKKLASVDNEYQGKLGKMKNEFESQRQKDKEAFEHGLAQEKLSGAAKVARQAEFAKQAAEREKFMAGQLAAMEGDYKEAKGQVQQLQEAARAKGEVAKQIAANLRAAGVKAEVDAQTGDVTIDFNNEYFDTDKSMLKPGMKNVLEKTFPAYAKALFSNKAIADKINSIEIVGFASPTYQGKFVDPANIDAGNRQAIDYNMDLSYSRARTIFQHVFDASKMTFEHQKRMLPLVKVTGRSFLTEAQKYRLPANANSKDFCSVHDCAKAQRVMVKFTLKDK